MLKISFIVLSLTLFSTNVFAQQRGTGGCKGVHQGRLIEMSAEMSDKRKLESAEGTLKIDGQEMSRFFGSELKINILFRSFKLRNDYGDMLEGKLTDLSQKTVNVSRLIIPAYAIDFKNIHLNCWSK